MIDITLPEAAWQDVEPGTEALVDQWLVREGDRVQAGQVLAKVVLVKTTLEITAPVDGMSSTSWCRPSRPSRAASRSAFCARDSKLDHKIPLHTSASHHCATTVFARR